MTVAFSLLAGAGAQFFNDNGVPLAGGKLYTYLAGTTTPQASYTTSAGNVAHANPIVLDSAGRVPNEIWLTEGVLYKFLLQDSNSTQIWVMDNISGAVASGAISNLLADLANTSNIAKGDALIGFRQASYSALYGNSVASTVHNKLREVVSVQDFGADPTGVLPSTAAFNNALAAASWVFVPPGTYLINATISISGNKVLTGPESSQFAIASAIINFTGTGNCFEATTAEFGGVTIRNLEISGGDGSGAYAIYNTRPQSIFENLLIENWDNSGIALEEAGTGSQASWSTLVRQVKYVAPATATPYRGYQVSINGGHVTLDGCVAIRGSIGINIDQGEAINIWRCSTNLQCNTSTFPFSSLSRDNQCGIRLSGDTYKTAVSIRHCYIEGFTYGIYVEKCESLSIEDNYIVDLGIAGDFVGTPGSCIYLKPDILDAGYVQNVTMRNNVIGGSGNGVYTLVVGENANHVEIYNNEIRAVGTTGNGQSPTAIYKQDGYLTYYGDNKLLLNQYVGVGVNDAYGLLAEMFWTSSTWTAEVKGSSTAGTYQIASQTNSYTIIGRQITLNAYITMAGSVTGGGSGNLAISLDLLGIPTKTGKKSVGSAMLGGVDFTTAGASISAEADGTNHATQIWFAETADATSLAYVPISGLNANDVIAFSITYEY